MPEAEGTSPESGPPRESGRSRLRWLRWAALAALVALLTAEGIYLWPRLHESWASLNELHWGWVGLSVAAQAASLVGYAGLQMLLVRAGGVRVSLGQSTATILGSTAISLTLPAGQVFSTAFTYRETRRWGASPLVASWQLVYCGVVAAAGLGLLGVAGAVFAGGRVSPLSVGFSLGAVVLISWGLQYAATHPENIEHLVARVLTRVNRARNKPDDAGMHQVRDLLDQLDSVKLTMRDGFGVVGWSAVHRAGDVACLAFACYAIGADPRWSGVLITFAVGKAVGTIPLAPGGLVFVDATLIATLTSAAGLTAAQSVAAALIYRIISFILVAIVGWIVFLLLFRHVRRENLEADLEMEQAEQAQQRSRLRRKANGGHH